jgi:hypothetical protein
LKDVGLGTGVDSSEVYESRTEAGVGPDAVAAAVVHGFRKPSDDAVDRLPLDECWAAEGYAEEVEKGPNSRGPKCAS